MIDAPRARRAGRAGTRRARPTTSAISVVTIVTTQADRMIELVHAGSGQQLRCSWTKSEFGRQARRQRRDGALGLEARDRDPERSGPTSQNEQRRDARRQRQRAAPSAARSRARTLGGRRSPAAGARSASRRAACGRRTGVGSLGQLRPSSSSGVGPSAAPEARRSSSDAAQHDDANRKTPAPRSSRSSAARPSVS